MSNSKLPKDIHITNIVGYLRKSRQDIEKEKRTGENTLDEQKKLMERVLDDYNIPYELRLEIGSGDKISTRPIFQEVLEELEQNKYNAIAVKEISRLGRGSYTDMGVIYDLIGEKRIFIITPWKIYDPKNPSDLRQIRFELFLSREEFETIRERLTGARYSAAMQGFWVAGHSPFGYQYNDNTRKLEPHPEQSKIIKLIFDYYINNLNGKSVSFRAISTHLTRLGVKTPSNKSTWYPLQIQRIITNSVYNGKISFRMTQRKGNEVIDRPESDHIIVPDAHEKIIDDEIWFEAQCKFNNRDSIPRTKLDFEPCELASLVVCKSCGRKMVRQYSVQNYKKKNGEVSKYKKEFLWCTTPGCTFVKYRDVEKSILRYLEELKILDDDKLRKFIINSTTHNKEEIINKNEVRKQVEQKKKELKNKLEFIFEKFESGVYTDEMFLERKNAIEKELKELKKVKFNEKIEEKKNEINLELFKNNIGTILNIYNELKGKTNRNTLLQNVFKVIELEIIQKGKGRNSTKYEITPYIKAKFLVQ